MKKIELSFHQSLDEYFKECIEIGLDIDVKEVKGWIKKFIMEAWQKLIEKYDINFIRRLDVVIKTYNPEITPLVTRDGVVIRLDLGREGIDYQDKDDIRSYIFHEIYHLDDRLDPKFNMNYHLDAESKGKKIGKIINIIWDLYIERRKFYIYGIRPIYCKDKKVQETIKIKEESKKGFLNIISDLNCDIKFSKSIFYEIWNKSIYLTYCQIFDYSMKICPKEEYNKSEC